MKVEAIVPTTQVVDILCDVCGASTTKSLGTQEFGTLEACWGYGSQHDGERYQVHLCEGCFFWGAGQPETGASVDEYVFG